jgi:hypothetical protein
MAGYLTLTALSGVRNYQQTAAPAVQTTGDTTPRQHTVWDLAVTTSGLK